MSNTVEAQIACVFFRLVLYSHGLNTNYQKNTEQIYSPSQQASPKLLNRF